MFLTRKTKLAVTAVACGVPLTGTVALAADRAIPDQADDAVAVEIKAAKASELVSQEVSSGGTADDVTNASLENSLKHLLEEERASRSSGGLPLNVTVEEDEKEEDDDSDNKTDQVKKPTDQQSTDTDKSDTGNTDQSDTDTADVDDTDKSDQSTAVVEQTTTTKPTTTTTKPPTTTTTKPPTTTTRPPSREAAYQAFWDAGYSFDQLMLLANEWNVSQFDAKARAGRAILAGDRSSFESVLNRHAAYDAWLDAGYNFEEVQILADAWNVSYFDAKARAGRAILAGDRSSFQPILDEATNP